MRDSALKPGLLHGGVDDDHRRRRAHARQRFETILFLHLAVSLLWGVGEELMRDSALKPALRARQLGRSPSVGEELMRDSALKPLP